jgi:hypothetical protein
MVCLHRTHHVDAPHVATNHCHDVAHVGAVHGDAVALILEVLSINDSRFTHFWVVTVLSFALPNAKYQCNLCVIGVY